MIASPAGSARAIIAPTSDWTAVTAFVNAVLRASVIMLALAKVVIVSPLSFPSPLYGGLYSVLSYIFYINKAYGLENTI